MLLDNSRQAGVEVVEGANVKQVRFEGSRATGVDVELADGSRSQPACRVVVDASGQTGLISRQLGLKTEDPVLKHCAYYTRYRGAVRGEGIDEGATLIMGSQPFSRRVP